MSAICVTGVGTWTVFPYCCSNLSSLLCNAVFSSRRRLDSFSNWSTKAIFSIREVVLSSSSLRFLIRSASITFLSFIAFLAKLTCVSVVLEKSMAMACQLSILWIASSLLFWASVRSVCSLFISACNDLIVSPSFASRSCACLIVLFKFSSAAASLCLRELIWFF